MEVIKLNLIPTGALPVVHASQYDEGRTFRAELFEGSAVYTLDGTEVLECDVKKPDGNVVTVAVVNTSASYVDIDTTLQMCACSGESLAELNIKKGGDSIGTLNFILAVERSPLENGITSDSGIHNLQTQIGDAVADQYDAANVVFDAAPTAGHGVGFAVTSEGVKTAVDNVAATIPEELDDLQDVTTSAPTSGEALVWDGSKWTNGAPSLDLDDLNDVTITSPSDDEILVYDNGVWVNKANPASTDNFGAPYDENTTYNVPSIVIYNNLLYKLNDGEDGTTGPWDPTKWTQTSLAELSGADIPIGTSSDTSTIAGAVGAVSASIPYIKYAEVNVTLDSSGEGTLFNTNVCVVGIKDIPSDSLYVGYAVYYAGSTTKCKAISRNSLSFTSSGITSQTRKIGVYYLDNISVQ